MAAFGFKTECNAIVDEFVLLTTKRLESNNFLKNPFYGKILKYKTVAGENYYVVWMKPLYFPFYWFGLLMALAAFILKGFLLSMWMLPGSLIFLLGFFWSARFYRFMLGVGLRKVGFKGKIRTISKEDIISDLMGYIPTYRCI